MKSSQTPSRFLPPSGLQAANNIEHTHETILEGAMDGVRQKGIALTRAFGMIAVSRRKALWVLGLFGLVGLTSGAVLRDPIVHCIESIVVSDRTTWTELKAAPIDILIQGNDARITGRFTISAFQNPQGEIDQVLVCNEDRVLSVLYSGRPGTGHKQEFDVIVPILRSPDGTPKPLFLVRMATLGVSEAFHYYESARPREIGWRRQIWPSIERS